MSEMIERVAKAMREHWYAYQIGGQIGGDLYITAKDGGAVLGGPFRTMEEAEFGRDCVIARAALKELREPTDLMGLGLPADYRPGSHSARQIWIAMIDKELEEPKS